METLAGFTTRWRRCPVLAALCGVIAAAGCGSEAVAPVQDDEPIEIVRVDLMLIADTLFGPGDTTTIVATGIDQNGNEVFGAGFTWESSSTAVATVSAAGLVTAVGDGAATITASTGTTSATVTVTVEIGPELANMLFADSNLEDCINGLGLTHINQVRELECVDKGIVTVLGIEALKRLRLLNLGTTLNSQTPNAVRNLSPLATLTALETLHVSFNGLTDIGPVSALTNLTSLNLLFNDIVDISALSTLTKLRELWLGYNEIGDVSPLATLTALDGTLDLQFNKVVDIGPLAGLKQLVNLWMRGNRITAVPSLTGFNRLLRLDLSLNPITDISTIAGLPEVFDLRLGQTGIDAADLSVLHSLPNLQDLLLDSLGLTDLSPLAGLPIRSVNAQGNRITDTTPLESLPNLRFLNLRKNLISDATSLGRMTALNSLLLDDNLVTDVTPLAALVELTYLSVPNNGVTTGTTALVSLTKAKSVILTGNSSIPCADLTALIAVLGSEVVAAPAMCAN